MEPEAFSALIQACGRRAYNFAYRLAGNEQDARDLVQEAFARALQHHDRYDPKKSFASWLHRILHNLYLDYVRLYAHNHTVSLDADLPPGETASWEDALVASDGEPIDWMMRQEMDGLVQQALQTLPIHYRTVLILCDIEGLPYDRISEITGCAVGTVRSRIHKARILIRKSFMRLKKGKPLRWTEEITSQYVRSEIS